MKNLRNVSGLRNNCWMRMTLLLLILMIVAELPATLVAQDRSRPPEWEQTEIAPGIWWESYLGEEFFGSRQSINLIRVDLNTANVRYRIAHSGEPLKKTSELAEQHDAIAAVNGSFFRADTGGPAAFLKIDGEVIASGAAHSKRYTESGAIAWGETGGPKILQRPEEGWGSVDLPHVMSAGPLLIYEGEIRSFNNDPFHKNRHPRTAVALTNHQQLILVTVDGRSFRAFGMTIPELARFLSELGAVEALNLDGGGSTSMWINHQKTDGIVNYPSDNFEFDHNGERGVSNAIMLIPD